MQKAKAFFLIAAGIFLLALAYHFGAQSAAAQSNSSVIAGFAVDHDYFYVITQDGSIYRQTNHPGDVSGFKSEWLQNFWTSYDEKRNPVKK
jgi:hypothetical protein